MKSLIATLLLIFTLTNTFAQQNVRGKWRTKKVVVDGLPSEWNNPLRLYDAETGLFFDIVNDSTHLIFCFQSKDPSRQIKINEAGMKIQIKAKGKAKCDASINFPLTEKKEQIASDQDRMNREGRIDQMKHGFVLRNANFLAAGFTSQNGTIPVMDTSGIRVAMNWDTKDVMTYEISIPLKELFGPEFALKDLTKVMTLKVEINAFQRTGSKSPENSPAASGGGMNTSGGAIGSGGMGSMGGSNGMGRSTTVRDNSPSDPMYDANTLKQGFFILQSR